MIFQECQLIFISEKNNHRLEIKNPRKQFRGFFYKHYFEVFLLYVLNFLSGL